MNYEMKRIAISKFKRSSNSRINYEKEGSEKEMIAEFYNRLKTGMKLQSDPTVRICIRFKF